MPGYATPTAPPAASERRVALYLAATGRPPQNWRDGAWTLVPDYRAEPLFRTADGAPFMLGAEYTGLGDLPSFLTDEPRPSPAHKWVNEGWTLDVALETERLAAAARVQRDALLAEADRLIAPLMTASCLGNWTLTTRCT